MVPPTYALALFALLPALASANDMHDPRYVARLRARHPQVSAAVLQRRAPASSTTTARARATRVPKVATTAEAPVPAAGNAASIPLNEIGTVTRPEVTQPLPTVYQAGAKSPVKGAPALPAGTIDPTQWPALDVTPPVSSAQMTEWLAQVDMSKVPTAPATAPGGCSNASNAAAVAAAGDTCWWTCGGCTRATDITFCPQKNTWGLSFDDGPSPDTPRLLDYLDNTKLKTTFFVVGSRAISRPDMLQYEYMDGHQLSVHTWSHTALTTLSNEQIVAELGWTKYAIKQITGVTPNTMRPPYGDIDDRVRAISLQMGLTPVIWTTSGGKTFDTQDWQIGAGQVTAATVLRNFDSILSGANSLSTGFIVLQHDLYQQSVDLATSYVLPQAATISPPLSLQPIITCLGKSLADAYIETASSNSTANFPSGAGAKPVSASPRAGSSGSAIVLAVAPSASASSNKTSDAVGSPVGSAIVPLSLLALLAAL